MNANSNPVIIKVCTK